MLRNSMQISERFNLNEFIAYGTLKGKKNPIKTLN